WFTRTDGLPGNSISAIHGRKDGELWVGTNGGVARFNGRRFMPVQGTETLTRVVAITSDDASVWLCDFTGLYQWRNQTTSPAGGPERRSGASSAYVDKTGRLWVGFVSGGV